MQTSFNAAVTPAEIKTAQNKITHPSIHPQIPFLVLDRYRELQIFKKQTKLNKKKKKKKQMNEIKTRFFGSGNPKEIETVTQVLESQVLMSD